MKKKHNEYNGNTDKRIIEKKLSKRTTSDKDLEGYLAQLPDVSDNAEEIIIDMEETKES